MVLQAYAALRKDPLSGSCKLRDGELKKICLEPPEGRSKGLLGRYVFHALMTCAYNAVHEFREARKNEYEDKRLPWPVDAGIIAMIFADAARLCGIRRKSVPHLRAPKRSTTPLPSPAEVNFDAKRQQLNSMMKKYRTINAGLEIMDTTS